MDTYRIISAAGQDMGMHEGYTPTHALYNMLDDAGHRHEIEYCPGSDSIEYDSIETEEICGTVEDYRIIDKEGESVW